MQTLFNPDSEKMEIIRFSKQKDMLEKKPSMPIDFLNNKFLY